MAQGVDPKDVWAQSFNVEDVYYWIDHEPAFGEQAVFLDDVDSEADLEAAIDAARAIDISVTGIDLMVRSPLAADYAFIEANERPGLANHEPQPTAERFIDLLFPLSIPAGARTVAGPREH